MNFTNNKDIQKALNTLIEEHINFVLDNIVDYNDSEMTHRSHMIDNLKYTKSKQYYANKSYIILSNFKKIKGE